mmetsp:Transcript_21240/g.32674  ORF Transcript_21240/g.32674 Transcript_21240/m.32674 type:complete len:617 (+) Transcript_21240:84-1934(+)
MNGEEVLPIRSELHASPNYDSTNSQNDDDSVPDPFSFRSSEDNLEGTIDGLRRSSTRTVKLDAYINPEEGDRSIQSVRESEELHGSTRLYKLKRRQSCKHGSANYKQHGSVSFVNKYTPILPHTQDTFFQDALNMAEGTIPQSIILAVVIGTCCGLAAYIYYTILFFLLEIIWKDLPNLIVVDKWPEEWHWLWIPIVGLTMAIGNGLTVVLLGEPGDLAYTVHCVHESAFVPINHVPPMFVASMFTILGGCSLGPEAPLVAICASLAGFISRVIFKQRYRNVVRKHTLMGMAGALAAFFGCPLGGSLFALEVCSRFGIEYFEHLAEAVFCGEICLFVFRTLSGLEISPIWKLAPTTMGPTEPWILYAGGAIGLLGAAASAVFALIHAKIMGLFSSLGLLDNRFAVPRALLGAIFINLLGCLIPFTMFWGEFEFEVIATRSLASELPYVWPTAGAIGFEMNATHYHALATGFCKLLAISFAVAGGFRGGFIFPFFTAGAAFGNVLISVIPSVPVQIACLCFAAGINVAITRTALATTLILSYLSGEQNALSAILAASICSLFATSYTPFIKTQIARSDIDHSLFFKKRRTIYAQDSIADVEQIDIEGIESTDMHHDM